MEVERDLLTPNTVYYEIYTGRLLKWLANCPYFIPFIHQIKLLNQMTHFVNSSYVEKGNLTVYLGFDQRIIITYIGLLQ